MAAWSDHIPLEKRAGSEVRRAEVRRAEVRRVEVRRAEARRAEVRVWRLEEQKSEFGG